MKPRDIFSHWSPVRAGLLATLDLFSEEELSFAPFEGSWSAGRIALHIADAEDGWFRYVVTRELAAWPPEYRLEELPNKEAVRGVLKEVHSRTERYLAELEEADLQRQIEAPWGESFRLGWVIWHVLEHEIHHRGELSLILGLLGREGLDV